MAITSSLPSDLNEIDQIVFESSDDSGGGYLGFTICSVHKTWLLIFKLYKKYLLNSKFNQNIKFLKFLKKLRFLNVWK